MTDKFTPPTTFPHECLDEGDRRVILHGVPQSGGGYVCEVYYGHWVIGIVHIGCLRDKPTVTSTWQNVYPKYVASTVYVKRQHAGNGTGTDRIAVLRRDTINGVTTCVLEDVWHKKTPRET